MGVSKPFLILYQKQLFPVPFAIYRGQDARVTRGGPRYRTMMRKAAGSGVEVRLPLQERVKEP